MVDIDELIGKVRGIKKAGKFQKAKPLTEYKLNYDAFAETLEPVYFWVLDFMQENLGLGLKVEKLVDNFTASPGSGYFADIGMRATRMQEQGMKILGTINTVMRSVLNLVYDLKEFEIRLSNYDAYRSKDEKTKEAGLLSLKQIWMDRVDIRKGGASINMLSQQLDFITLRDAFMRAKNPNDVDKLDLNERVKRILKPRVAEFLDWVDRSEKELRTRYGLQKSYLKSQVNALKLYTRWVKPYLKASEELMMMNRDLSRADLVTAFNTVVLELQLLGISKFDIDSVRRAISAKEFPENFQNARLRQNLYACLFVDFSFRGLPRIASKGESTHYVHSGRTSMVLKSYVLNEDEYNLLKKEIEKSEVFEGLRLVEGVTADTLEPIHEDLMRYIDEKPEKKAKSKSIWDSLFGTSKSKKKEMERPRRETFLEKQIRELLAETKATKTAYKMYDTYKKAHGMPTPMFEFTSVPGQ
ncbi:MAG: hypothetical protein KJ767_00330 [Nanoarchaeota archaeon]|nr:hypothetical protein [Nanoarchaeota archaeon]